MITKMTAGDGWGLIYVAAELVFPPSSRLHALAPSVNRLINRPLPPKALPGVRQSGRW